MKGRTALTIAAAGAVATTAASIAFHMPAHDALRMAGIAGGSALLAGTVGTVVLHALRRRAIGAQVAAVALASVGAVGVGAMVAAQAMFIVRHDLDSLLVILLASGTIGALVAFLLGHRVSTAGRTVEALARRIGDGVTAPPVALPPTAEFAALAQELEQMGTRLAESRARERAIDAARSELIAWVSHDLRTPLAGMRAISEALEDGLVEDAATLARYHRTLRIETDRLARLVDELFELSVINAGALRLRMERVSLGDLVSDSISAARASAEGRRVRIEGRMSGQPPELELAPTEVSRVLHNLLDNAIRHTPAGGSVCAETGIDEGAAYVSVMDECGGIPERDLPRVFDAAFRGEPARTPEENGGAGLGLAIARGIIEAHRGQITVANDGVGCRFTVRLPLSQPA
jgi:signal transduction histidine kinase